MFFPSSRVLGLAVWVWVLERERQRERERGKSEYGPSEQNLQQWSSKHPYFA